MDSPQLRVYFPIDVFEVIQSAELILQFMKNEVQDNF